MPREKPIANCQGEESEFKALRSLTNKPIIVLLEVISQSHQLMISKALLLEFNTVNKPILNMVVFARFHYIQLSFLRLFLGK